MLRWRLIHDEGNPRVILLFVGESQHPTRRITTTNGEGTKCSGSQLTKFSHIAFSGGFLYVKSTHWALLVNQCIHLFNIHWGGTHLHKKAEWCHVCWDGERRGKHATWSLPCMALCSKEFFCGRQSCSHTKICCFHKWQEQSNPNEKVRAIWNLPSCKDPLTHPTTHTLSTWHACGWRSITGFGHRLPTGNGE